MASNSDPTTLLSSFSLVSKWLSMKSYLTFQYALIKNCTLTVIDRSTGTARNFCRNFDRDESIRKNLLFDVPADMLPESDMMFGLENEDIEVEEEKNLDGLLKVGTDGMEQIEFKVSAGCIYCHARFCQRDLEYSE